MAGEATGPWTGAIWEKRNKEVKELTRIQGDHKSHTSTNNPYSTDALQKPTVLQTGDMYVFLLRWMQNGNQNKSVTFIGGLPGSEP